MRAHEAAFAAECFFLGGVFAATEVRAAYHPFVILGLLVGLCASILLLFRRAGLAALSVFLAVGAAYFFAYDAGLQAARIPFGKSAEVSGMVVVVARSTDRQTVTIALETPYRGNVAAYVPRYPEWRYGDQVAVRGSLEAPALSRAAFFAKAGVGGVMRFPTIELRGRGGGSAIRRGLFAIKDFMERTFARTLPPAHAVFLSGLLLGDTGGFSKEFRAEMSATGTSHLVALSGYNITILAVAVGALFGSWLPRRATFALSTLAIIGFVLMTGAEASVVRAALMGFLFLLAGQTQRLYSIRHALAFAAIAMAFLNPYVLRYDIGFQLSFAAVLGLTYVKPALQRIFRATTPGVFNWRDNLFTTASAQLAVLPILLSSFGSFSPLSLVTNVLILAAIPLTMLLGFLIALLGAFSLTLALPVAWLTQIFSGYELWIITIFSRIGVTFAAPHAGAAFAVFYYALLIAFVWYVRKRITSIAPYA